MVSLNREDIFLKYIWTSLSPYQPVRGGPQGSHILMKGQKNWSPIMNRFEGIRMAVKSVKPDNKNCHSRHAPSQPSVELYCSLAFKKHKNFVTANQLRYPTVFKGKLSLTLVYTRYTIPGYSGKDWVGAVLVGVDFTLLTWNTHMALVNPG